MQLVDVFRARVVDVSPDSLVIEITGTEDKIDGLVEMLKPYGVLEMARTGRVAMSRGAGGSRGRRVRRAHDAIDDEMRARQRHFLFGVGRGSRGSRGHADTYTGEVTMAKMFYDKDADIALIANKRRGDHRLRVAGARACAEPARQRRRRPGRPAGRRARRARRPRPTG